jgi:hypothetical protein
MNDLRAGARDRVRDARSALFREWWLLGAGVLLTTFLAWILFPLPETPSLAPDNLLFQYAGYQWVEGHPMYLAIWDLKPPGVFEASALLAVVAGGDPMVHHWLSVVTTNLLLVANVILIAKLTHSLTGRPGPALLAGFSLLASPAVVTYAMVGIYAEYYVIFLGLLSLWWIRTERYALSGFAGALATAFHPTAIVFPAIVLAAAAARRRPKLPSVVAAMAGATVVILLPVALSGALVPMLNQVVGGTIAGPGGADVAANVSKLLTELDRFVIFDLEISGRFTWLFVAGGLLGASAALVRDRETWPYAVPALWFLLKVLVLDYDSFLDLLLLLAFAGLGLGLAFRSRARWQTPVLAGLAALLALSVLAALPVYAQLPPGAAGDPAGMLKFYFDATPPPRCHLRMSGAELQFVERTGGSLARETCRTEFLLDELLSG